jgi:Rieske Fe-S protein
MRRKHFIIGAGLGIATVVAACSNKAEAPQQSEAPQESAGPTTEAVKPLAKTADVPVGSGMIGDDIVLTQPSAGDFKGFSTICTHAGCTVGEVAGGTINCPCHGSKFNLDGTVANGPASRPLTVEAVTVQGDSIVRG